MKRGIDVSDNQGVINWSRVKAAGVEFAVLRSTRGSGKTDYQFVNNVKGCCDNGIPFDVYKYTYALDENAAKKEMKLVCELLKANNICCTVWFDIEEKKLRALGKDAITKIVKAAETVAGQYGYPFGIYCNKDWYDNVIDTKAFDNAFWIARYPSKKKMTLSQLPGDDNKPQVTQELFGWQCSSNGIVDGINKEVDLDVIYQESSSSTAGNGALVKANPFREPDYTLYRGRMAMQQEHVKWLQYYLVEGGYLAATYKSGSKNKNSIDGKFGERTEKAVEMFQLKHPGSYSTKKPDKRVGPATKKLLREGK